MIDPLPSLSPLILFFLVAGCAHAPVFAPVVEAPPHCPSTTAEHEARIEVLTINVRHDVDQWRRRFELIADEIARLDPDVIGVQELSITQDQGPYLVELLQKRGRAKYELATSPYAGFAGAQGIGILSRWPIVHHARAELGDERVALLSRIRHPSGGLFDFATTHLDPHRGAEGEMRRDQETTRLLAFLSCEDECRPLMLTGDLNSLATGHAMGRLGAARFVDSWHTVHPNPRELGNTGMIKLENGAFVQRPRRRIDFVLARPAGERTLTPIASDVVFANHDAKGFYPSDHLGVMTTFDVKM